jgi:purine-cytosine permease-like protein
MNTGVYHEGLPEIIIGGEYLGLGFVGFVVLLLAQWTTNDSNLYSSVLALNNIFRIRRWKMTVVVGVAASLFAALGILERLELFLIILTVSIGPIGGIFLCDHYLLKRTGRGRIGKRTREGSKAENKTKNKEIADKGFERGAERRINWKALGVYAAACLIGWTTSGHPWTFRVFPFSIFAFNGILSSVVLYYLVMKLFPDRA